MNSITLLYMVAQYGVYAFIGYWAYRKVILPYLMHERQNSLLQEIQLQQSLSLMRQQFEHFNKQVNYFVQLFEKFKTQYKKAQEKNELLKLLQQNEFNERKRAYRAEQEQLEKQRILRAAYNEIVPEVYKQLRFELRNQTINNDAYLKSALKKLKNQAEARSNQ